MSPTIAQFMRSVEDERAKRERSDRRGKDITHTRTRRSKRHLSPLEIAIDDAKRRAASGEWQGAIGATYVGLYAFCHQMVYGVLPGELEHTGTFRAAAKQAAGCAHESFADDPARVVDFVRWAWEREKGRDAWARGKGIERNRLGWRAQFSRGVVTDYHAARSRRR